MFDIYYLINYFKKILLYSQLLISHYSYGAKRLLFEFKKRLTVRDFFFDAEFILHQTIFISYGQGGCFILSQ
jgi:hypothetical protein